MCLAFLRSTVLEVCFAVTLLFVVPGWFITSWRRYSANEWDIYERIYWIVVLSISVVISSGVLLNAIGELSRREWLVWAIVIVLFLAAVDLLVSRGRGVRSSASNAHDSALVLDGIDVGQSRRSRRRLVNLPLTSAANVVLLTASLCLVLGAIWL